MKETKIIFNADDLGMSTHTDNEILSAANCGLIQSASISVVNGLDHDQFKKFLNLKYPLELGLHINLTQGKPLSHSFKIARLIDNNLVFKSAIELLSDEENLKEEVLYVEMKAQLEKFVQLSGQKPNHIDSHQHYTYLSPIAFSAFLRLANSENIKIRSPLPFINELRLKRFVDSVKERYGISIPFSAEKQAQKLQNIFTSLYIKLRTVDCLTEIPNKIDLENNINFSADIEVICHPQNLYDKEKLKLLYQSKVR